MNERPKVAIIYLSYHSDEYLSDMVAALAKSDFSREQSALVIVDNPHLKYGSSIKKIEEVVLPSQAVLPPIIILPQSENKGFCGGNNIGIDWAVENGFDYIFLHNQDGYVSPDCIRIMVEVMETDVNIGCAQALVILDKTTQINTAGNSFNYLGFGFIPNFGIDENKLNLEDVKDVGYASGAALMLRTKYVLKYGKLDADLFAYHEDVEYSLRMRLVELKTVLVSRAKFYHKYIFNRNSSKFYYLERNRYAVLLMYYKWPTLVLLFPMLLLMELGLFVFFVLRGWTKEKVDIYRYWFDINNIKMWLQKRAEIQKIRKISDRKFLYFTTSTVSFGEKQDLNNPLLKYFANPIMFVYKLIAQIVIFW